MLTSCKGSVDGPQSMWILMLQHQRPLTMFTTLISKRKWGCYLLISCYTLMQGLLPLFLHWLPRTQFLSTSLLCQWESLALLMFSLAWRKEKSGPTAILSMIIDLLYVLL